MSDPRDADVLLAVRLSSGDVMTATLVCVTYTGGARGCGCEECCGLPLGDEEGEVDVAAGEGAPEQGEKREGSGVDM